ncbi:LexA family transcriptional regulator [Magnetococcus sp. PR-3]|uniref:LexA family transcriptional regulator n=1 Tax=Magnetococcus sp. PR-3 TaxID=3120355 RepID=UPI002FCDE5EE
MAAGRAKRLQELLVFFGWKPAELHRRSKVSKATISNLLNSDYDGTNSNKVENISMAFGINPYWIERGQINHEEVGVEQAIEHARKEGREPSPPLSEVFNVGTKLMEVANAHNPDKNTVKLQNHPIHADGEVYGSLEPWDSSTPLGDDEVMVKFFTETELSAGGGSMGGQENGGPALRFSSSTFRRTGVDPTNAVTVKVTGDSMEPMFSDNTVIGVDVGHKNVVDGKIYAFRHGDMLRVKFLYRIPNGLRLVSLNEAKHPEEIVKGDDLLEVNIIGRVFWSSSLHF